MITPATERISAPLAVFSGQMETFGWGYLVALTGVVLIGAALPVVPTGAAVSAAAALATYTDLAGLAGVLVAAAELGRGWPWVWGGVVLPAVGAV
jgi:hypothetical protein